MKAQRTHLRIAQSAIDDLRARLRATRWPTHSFPPGWQGGTDLSWLAELVDYWATDFDWRAQEARLDRYPQFEIERPDAKLHYLHIEGEGPSPFPLLLLHGWPGSVFEFEKIIPLLTQPSRFGGKPSDAFTLVVPGLPGFGASYKAGQVGASIPRMADELSALMTGLGYTRFGVQGGDLGASVASVMSLVAPAQVAGIHLNFLPIPRQAASASQDADIARFNGELAVWLGEDAAYGAIQGTRPQTLAAALNDSPAGLAAWIVEKLRAWSDCEGRVESVFGKDEILATVSLYWLTETIATSFAPYHWRHREGWPFGPDRPIVCPTGYCEFPGEVLRPPRALAGQSYRNLLHWVVAPRGGHFAAWEQPDQLASAVRDFFRMIR